MKWLAGQRITADRLQQGDPTDISTYVPVVGGLGTGSLATTTGYYTITDQWVDVLVYLTGSVAGSGTALITVTMPTNVDRSTRQGLTVHAESVGAGNGASATTSAIRGGECVFFTSGSGAVSDRIRIDESVTVGNEQNFQGNNFLAAGIVTIWGRYRRA